ncbi:MAG: T9SS type A sorting domain-containing protein [Cryomorphaceae bacterium]|nr:T9SS type A sorting domain-containing protein [Cryomorphaceae bacterium]
MFVDSLEYLLYDFSIMEGDTVSIFAKKMGSFSSCDSVLSFYVTKTDTFIDLNGTPRKQIEMLPLASVSYNCYFGMIPLTWIEGIGSNKGFSIVAEDFQTYMLCVSEYGAQLYQGDMTDTCWLGSTIGVENFEQQSFQIYPNPATSEVTISNSSEIYLISSIVIYDLSGNVLQRHEGLSVAEKTIDISQLRSGMYVLGIIDGDGGYYRKKLQIAR